MTTTDLAVIENDDAEVAEWQPLSKTEAKKLDKKIRSTGDKMVASHAKTQQLWAELLDALNEAKQGEIHKALNIKSWTAYLADAVNITPPTREDRKEMALFLSGEGAPQRAIAKMLNASQKTIDRDLDGEDVEEGATVVSLDGAERPKNGKPVVTTVADDEDYIEGEVVEESEPMTAAEIVTSFADNLADLYGSANELELLRQEDKWAGARKRIIKADLNNLTEVIAGLQVIVDDLMAPE